MYYRKTVGGRIFDAANGCIMILISLICLAPLIHVLFASISDPTLVSSYQGLIWHPLGKVSLEGYKRVFQDSSIWMGYFNTIFYVVAGCVLNVIMTCIGAYVLSRKTLATRNFWMAFISITMVFNGGLIPTYMIVKNLGMIDTRAAMIIPGALSAFNLIIMRTSFMSLPAGLEEAARIDGANDFTILFRIIIPLSKAVIAVIVLFTAVGVWNSWFNAMIYLRDSSKWPLQMVLKEILIQNDISSAKTGASAMVDLYNQLIKYAAIIVATLPILCVYPFVQKYFVKGVLIGSLKG